MKVRIKKLHMIERAKNGHLQDVSSLSKWREWVQDSGLLISELRPDLRLREMKRLIRSPIATVFATMPTGVEHVCNELKLDELQDGDIVAEAGTGPGTIMRGVLRRVRADIRYIAVELKPKLAQHLDESFDDSRIVVVNESAENLAEIIRRHGDSARRVISTMPFSTDDQQTKKVLGQIKESLTADGLFLMGNFNPISIVKVIEAFGREHCETGFATNIPPLLTVLAKNPNGNGKH